MPNKKNIFVLLFLIPLLWAISALSYSIDLNPLKKTDSSVFIQKQNNTYNTFQTAPVNARKTINVLDETEPEFEIEFDLFYDDLEFNLDHYYLLTAKKSNYAFSHFSLKHKVPLYVLFCNWKFHTL
jgi:hypothetical protein